jgi:hypothetical protein
MAEEVVTTPAYRTPIERERQREREGLSPARPRVSWGAIFGGAFAALGLWLLLYVFGLAMGLSTMDPNNPGSVKGSGIFTGIWSALSPLIALFIGGLVAGRLSGVFSRGHGALHGLIMWGLVSVAGVYFVGNIVASTISGAASAGKAVVQGGGEAIKGVVGGVTGAASQLGLDWNTALGPVNQRLRAQGKPAVTADELQSATKDAVQGSIRRGSFDRATFENALARNTKLSRQDAQEVSQQIEQQFNQMTSGLQGKAQGALQSAETGALKVADVTGKALWGVFGALLLGLAAAIVGGVVGAPKLRVEREEVARGPRVRPEPTPPRGPIITTPPREAYPR